MLQTRIAAALMLAAVAVAWGAIPLIVRGDVPWQHLVASLGYQLVDNDLVAENFRSRDKSWDYGRIAVEFFSSQKIPFWEMTNADTLVGNEKHDNSRYCFAKENEVYLVYLPNGNTTMLDLSKAKGEFSVDWFDPRNGGAMKKGTVPAVKGGAPASLGMPPDTPDEDWLAVVRRN
jgi:hypothetical protein